MSEAVATTVSGSCVPRFERVREEFERNFVEREELGASLCVILDGEPVVDLWGGVADAATGRRWERDTLSVVMSCTKGATALCAHILIDRGQLELERPVAAYWPEFAKLGKDEITVRMVLNHQSGVAHVSPTIPDGGCNDWELMIGLVEDTVPFWQPGTRQGYHAITIGYIVGELVRRITGRTVGAFFREEVAEPLGLDFFIGLPAEHEHRVAPSVPFVPDPDKPLPPHFQAAFADPDSLPSVSYRNLGGWFGNWDTREAHAAELPAVGGVTNARGLAGMYAPLSLGGALRDVRLVSAVAVDRMRAPQSMSDVDALLLLRTSFTLGFSKSWPNRELGPSNSVIIGEDAFGTPGMGGQIAFADPACHLAFAYTMNRHGLGTGMNERGQSLVDAAYEILGSPSSEPGFWVRPPR
jgi:CubicO group peptidase (beta-lactamase class C family)